jgi:cyclopropane-fatty-acyl-phospholipid synthase
VGRFLFSVFPSSPVSFERKNQIPRTCAASTEWVFSMSSLNSNGLAELAMSRAPNANRMEEDNFCPADAGVPWSISFSDGGEEFFGSGRPVFSVEARNQQFWRAIQRKGTYAMAMAFVEGRIEIKGDLVAAVRWWLAHRNPGLADLLVTALSRLSLSRVACLFQSRGLFHSRSRAARNIEFHYDRLVEFYKCFLDENLVYSCAYFHRSPDSLEHAQISKLEHICRKLELKPGDRFLDIGCGWGALPLHAAKHYGVNSTGCTLSDRQFEFAQERAIREGWAETVRICQLDYRDVAGTFEKIASVGMFEHVGRRRPPKYFKRVSELLAPDGLFLNHGIIRPQKVNDGPETVFLRRHVFPGGELAHLSDVVLAAEKAGFEVLDIENLRPHYALTCREWVSRLQSRSTLAMRLAGVELYRTWLLYLAASSASFEAGHTDIYQLLMSKRGSGRSRHLTRIHMHGPGHEAGT